MKKFAEQLKKQAESLQLKASERAELRGRLLSYMEYHPLRDGQSYTDTYRSRRTFPQFANAWFISKAIGATAVFCLIVVPVMAEKALPGDVLYPVKVRFNEEVLSNFALSPYEKVEWQTTLLERRIAEARLLASEGKLTPEVEAEVADAVRQHSDAAQVGIAAIRVDDSEEAAIAEITFASALEVQSEVLEGHIARDASTTDFGRSVASLSGAVNAVRDTAVATQAGEKASYEKLSAKLETETTRAEELFASINGAASEAEMSSVRGRLASIQTKINKASELYYTPELEEMQEEVVATSTDEEVATSTEDVDVNATSTATSSVEVTIEPMIAPKEEAILILRSALTDTQKLISFMTDIDVRINVSIDELLPVEEAKDDQDDEDPVDTEDVASTADDAIGSTTKREEI